MCSREVPFGLLCLVLIDFYRDIDKRSSDRRDFLLGTQVHSRVMAIRAPLREH